MFPFPQSPDKMSSANEVTAKLNEKGVRLPCPRCGRSKFNIVGEHITQLSVPSTPTTASHVSQLPIIIIGCDNCGYLIHHAKGPLGLLK